MISLADLPTRQFIHITVACVCLVLAQSNVFAGENGVPAESRDGQALFAKVGDKEITVGQYQQYYNRTIRERFYHSKPPEAELVEVRKQVGEELIIRELALLEAARLGLEPDSKKIQDRLEQYDKRYAESPRWQQQRAALLGALKVKLEQDDLVKQVERRGRNVAPPSEEELMAYYRQYPEKFTEPMQQKLSLILLVVDPSSTSDVWQAALEAGRKIVGELRGGADFAEYAREYSADVSAEKGGDMGYVHREMLSSPVQQALDKLEPGEISDAIRTLQGVAVLRLEDRKPEHLREFADVKDRAGKLWMRERSEAAWMEFKAKLRADTPVTIYINETNSENDV